jgi:hypothetical protein
MTSLQETAMGGGPATAKTASYVLVAADAGTTVAMNAAGATTITVNTGLFAAGDTVFIQNLGAGACTVTAGTATVATAGSLILPQNDAGILYFTATGAAIFYDYIQAGAVSPLTTKGDLYTFSTSDARLGVGANGTTLVADSAEATGLKWATPAAPSPNFALINAGGTALSGNQTVTISGLSGKNQICIGIDSASTINTGSDISIRINGDTGTNYNIMYFQIANTTVSSSGSFFSLNQFNIGRIGTDASHYLMGTMILDGCNSAGVKPMTFTGVVQFPGSGNESFVGSGNYQGTSVVSSVAVRSASGNFDAGTIYVWAA